MAKKTAENHNPSQDAALPFDAAMRELEQLVQNIESGELSLEASVQAYQRGAALVKHCRETLMKVEQQVSVLEGDLLKPLQGVNEDDDGVDD